MTLLVRDVMTIGVPVCRDAEPCGRVVTRLQRENQPVVVALDEDGMACGWLTCAQLESAPPTRPCGEVMDEAIPTVSPDLPVEAAVQLMRERGVEYLFLMHAWPGEPRPAAVISLTAIERQVNETAKPV